VPDRHLVDALHPVVLHHVVNSLGWPHLRPLQQAAAAPVAAGDDALLLAPTAGGKTEAAVFAVLSRMADQDWHGLSVLYLCPLKALLNNLLPRVETYTGWLGRRAGLWHGDVTSSQRRRILREPPDVPAAVHHQPRRLQRPGRPPHRRSRHTPDNAPQLVSGLLSRLHAASTATLLGARQDR
jgi:hypothetical protein